MNNRPFTLVREGFWPFRTTRILYRGKPWLEIDMTEGGAANTLEALTQAFEMGRRETLLSQKEAADRLTEIIRANT